MPPASASGSGAPTPGTASPPPATPPVPDADEAVCLRLFNSGKVEARALEAIGGGGGCGIAAPVELFAVIVSPTRRIRFEPPVTIDCALGEAVADWVRDDVAPAFAAAALPLDALASTSGYACRSRNSVRGAKISEHARGNALDIGLFVGKGRPPIAVRDPAPILDTIRTTACTRFATVLGPGSDGFHETHMHVDLETRRHSGHLCHWVKTTPAGAAIRGPH